MKRPIPRTARFENTLEEFRRFIIGEGFPEEIVWAFREDVTSRRRMISVRWPLPADNAPIVRDRYEIGIRRGLGVRIEALCLVNGRSCCHLWLPENEEAASYAMLDGIKFSVDQNPVTAQPIQNALSWWWTCRLDRLARSTWVVDSCVQPRDWPEAKWIPTK